MLKILSLQEGLVELKNVSEITAALTWVDVTNITAEEASLLQEKFDLHPLTVEDLGMARTRIKVEEFNNYLFCVFYSLQKNKSLKVSEIDFILGKNILVTNHVAPLPSITELQKDKEKAKKLLSKGVDFLFHYLLSQEVESFYPVLDSLDREIDHVEDLISKEVSTEVLQKVISLKKRVIHVKKIALSQKEKVSILAKSEFHFLHKKVIPYFRDVYDNAIKVFETVENYRESVSSVYELYMSTVSNNLNEVMKVLSVIATVALPLTVISSIYGTNFEVLPGSTAKYGFWVMILVMLGIVGAMMVYFKKKGWF